MKLKKLVLENIRSYENEEIDFPEGITLIAGDVGTGKSTLLLAIEFALFGISKGDINGEMLLRKGKTNGTVELHFYVDESEYIIKRGIKKTSAGINQEAGYIKINGIQHELTPTELKNRIFTILNYPLEYINKRPMIYKYTVYTPQEEMKSILLGNEESRIETLRKVFNIDKYQRVKNNSRLVISTLKEKRRQLLGYIEDLEEKKSKSEEYGERLNSLRDKINPIKDEIENLEETINLKKVEMKNFEEKKKEIDEINSKIRIIEYDIKTRNSRIESNKNELSAISNKIKELEEETNSTIDFELIKNKKVSFEDNLKTVSTDIKTVEDTLLELKLKKDAENKIKKSIFELDVCPICKQNVLESYKIKINNEANSKIEGYDIKSRSFTDKHNTLKESKLQFEEHIKTLIEKEREFELLKFRKYDLEKKKERHSQIEKESEENTKIINDLEIKRKTLFGDLSKISLDIDYEKIKVEFSKLLEKEKNNQIEKGKIEREIEVIEENINSVKKEIEKKEKTKREINKYLELKDWLEKDLVNLMDTIEKNVMAKIHMDFSKMFIKWFELLIEEEVLKVSLDEKFSPKIEQNGYDIDYENLSGGEKTACALAYRLALNQTINHLVSTINTKDLIILDEPTDGFSSEQLDRVRLVLNELNMKQIIIVSHEQKIESFCDNIIRIKKDSHISEITS